MSQFPYLRVLCVEILLPEIIAESPRVFSSMTYKFIPDETKFRFMNFQNIKALERHILV